MKKVLLGLVLIVVLAFSYYIYNRYQPKRLHGAIGLPLSEVIPPTSEHERLNLKTDTLQFKNLPEKVQLVGLEAGIDSTNKIVVLTYSGNVRLRTYYARKENNQHRIFEAVESSK